MDQAALVDLLKRHAATDWPRLWAAVYAHREACVAALVAELEAALAQPGATRQSVLRRVRDRARVVAETGAVRDRERAR